MRPHYIVTEEVWPISSRANEHKLLSSPNHPSFLTRLLTPRVCTGCIRFCSSLNFSIALPLMSHVTADGFPVSFRWTSYDGFPDCSATMEPPLR